MSFETIEEVLKQLREINFDGFIELAGRGEPSLHPEFEKVVNLVTQQPRTWKVRVTTNGYRIKKLWNGVYQKVDELILNTYTNSKEYEDRLQRYARLNNGTPVEQYFKPDTLDVGQINALPGQKDTRNGKYFKYAFNNRAGWFSEEVVNSPCYHPMRQIFIDYHGNYQMCCNDWKYQIKIGNIHERGMIDMYLNDPKMNRIRWALLNGQRREILPCSMCDDDQGGKEPVRKVIDRFKQTNSYKFHVCKIAGSTGVEYRTELKGAELIPVYEIG